jgi:hypothetical protein
MVCDWVAQRIPGCERGFDNAQGVGFLGPDGGLQAGVVYHNWSPESGTIEISAASENRAWLTKDRLFAIFDYPPRIGCRMTVARTGESNARVRRIWRSLGANEYVIPALRSPTEAEIILTLPVEKWREYAQRLNRGKAKGTDAP